MIQSEYFVSKIIMKVQKFGIGEIKKIVANSNHRKRQLKQEM